MKLRCTTKQCVRPKHQSNLPTQITTTKFVQSTLALCKHPNKLDDHCIILFTAQNKKGTKYKLKHNVQQIFTKFIHEGKATIQFREPFIDLFISCDVTPLRGFLHLLKRVLCGEITDKELSLSSLAVSDTNLTKVCKKMVIQKRSEYPTKGFPRTLEHLVVNDISSNSVGCGVLKLLKLRVLDLSKNCIAEIPREIKQLSCLVELYLANNLLGNNKSARQWDWIGGNLSKTLNLLNLKGNGLNCVPKQIAHLKNLITLNLDDNDFSLFPSSLCHLNKLENLTMSNNNIEMLPFHIKRLNLNTLDISGNNFPSEPMKNCHLTPKVWPIKSLKDISAISVLSARLDYSEETLPIDLCRFLCNVKFCYCSRPIFDVYKEYILPEASKSLARNVVHSNDMVLLEVYFCSLKCNNLFRKKRAGVQR